jgi:hypothetical protein
MHGVKRVSGATLIELLVVITLMMTVLALVGGGVGDTVAKSKAQAEVILVLNLVKKASVKAFSTGSPVALFFVDNECRVAVDKKLVHTQIFDFLSFESRQINISRNGLPDEYFINAQVKGLNKKIDWAPFFREFGLTDYVPG